MKNLKLIAIRFTFSVLAVMVIGSLSNCKNSDDPALPSKQEQVSAILTASAWKVNTVSVDGIDKTSIYKDLGLTFTNTSFSSVSGAAIWPASGTWTFTSTEATAFTRDDGLVVTINEATETSLKLALTWNKTTLSSGKTGSASGAHVFSFRK